MVSPFVWSGLILLGMSLVVVMVGGVLLRHRRTKGVTNSTAGTRPGQHLAPRSAPVASEAGCSMLFAVAWIVFSILVALMVLGVMSSQWQADNPGRSVVVILFLGSFALVASLFGVIGGWMLAQSGRAIALAWSLARQGKMVDATVIDRWIDKDTGGDTISCVAYRFSVPDGPVIETAEVSHAAYSRNEINDKVMVQYLPQQPEICRLVLQVNRTG